MKINTINHIYKLCDKCVTHTDSIKYEGVRSGTTFFFQSFKLLEPILAVTY